MLPLWDNYSSIVWSLPEDLCEELQSIPEKDFIDRLNMAYHAPSEAPIGGLFDKVLPKQIKGRGFEHPPLIDALHTKRFAFPLTLSHANSLASYRMALLGDAAHRIHPLAGQGLNLGLSDVAYLSNVIVKALKEGQDIGNYDFVLSDYERQSKANAQMIIAAVEFVKNAYGPKLMGNEGMGHVLALGRNAALDVIELSDFIKYNLMNFASGNVNHPSRYEWTKE